ncbi:MAG: hypothetical protein ABJA02_13165 [Acidobacteriota bacterium]
MANNSTVEPLLGRSNAKTDSPSFTDGMFSKVPQVTIFFWIIKVLCTTVGETASDFLNVNLGLGLKGTAIAAGMVLAIVLFFQFRARKYVPAIYWLTVVLISVFGTLVTDILTDSLGFPLEASTIIFSAALAGTFAAWYASEGTLSIHSILTTRRETFYWLAILFTFALGTATGDLMAEKLGLGYVLTGLIVLGIIAAAMIGWRLGLDAVLAFWIAYIMTRPLGASLGDYLSQSQANGGLGMGATITSVVFLLAILLVVVYLAVTQRDFIAETVADNAEKPGQGVVWQVAAVVALFLVLGGTGYYLRTSQLQRKAAASVTRDKPLGDLSAFRNIAEDMLTLVRSGDLAGAKTRADDLETAWDNGQAIMRPMNPNKWALMDGAVDDVLTAVRAPQPDPTASIKALSTLINVIDTLGERKARLPAKPAVSGTNAKPLGDLSHFRTIASELRSKLISGDLKTAKARADDLESSWDAAQSKLRPLDPEKWTQMDAAIDETLKKVRSPQPKNSETVGSIDALLSVIQNVGSGK